MRLSTNRRYQQAKQVSGFDVVNFDTIGELKDIVVFDHSPAIFDGGIRNGKNVKTCDCVILEVDNIDTNISIDDFQVLYFPTLKYWITTSRSHQKEKNTGNGMSAPTDRYHVIFPMPNPITKHEYESITKQMSEEFQFFDSSCTDASRFFFGNKDTEVFFHDGEYLELLAEAPPVITTDLGEWEYDYTNYQSSDRNAIIYSALQLAQANDAFYNYSDWIKVGMALKADGWNVEDWINISNSDINVHEAHYKWETFPESGGISGATLLYYARKGNPNCLVKGKQNEITLYAPMIEAAPANDFVAPVIEKTIATTRPSRLDHDPHPEVVKKVKNEIYYKKTDEEGKEQICLHDDWFYRCIAIDAELGNCLHFDYTIAEFIYECFNTRQLDNWIIQRLCHYVSVKKVTSRVVELIRMRIEEMNGKRNRCIEIFDSLIKRHPHDSSKEYGWELDEFLKIFRYSHPVESPFTQDELNKSYKEVWHLFFLRMHMHVEGTRIVNGNYKNLMANDIVPILQGKQDIGKTTLAKWIALEHLSPEFYVDVGSGSKDGFGGMATAKMCRGRVLTELGEMKIMKKADDVEVVKSFISKTQYDIDQKYIEHSRAVPVTTSFIGTANGFENLSDPTGNRRWWPMWIESIDKDWISSNKDHIEKLHAFYARIAREANVSLWYKMLTPSDSLMGFIDIARKKSMIRYADFDAIIQVVSDNYNEVKNENNFKKKFHTVHTAEVERLCFNAGFRMRIGKESISQALIEMGYQKAAISINGHTVSGWKKEIDRIMSEY
jgi:hypothetical protein